MSSVVPARAVSIATPSIALVTAGALVFSLAPACSSETCADLGTCAAPTPPPSPPDGDAGPRVYPEVPPPPGCEPDKDPKDTPECMVDAFALFVDAANGSNANPGTKSAPLRTLAAAMDNDKLAGRPRVYVCADAPQTEPLTVAPNVSIFGGFACDGWKPIIDGKSAIAPSEPGIALRVPASSRPVRFADLDIKAAAAVAPGESSVAVLVVSATATFLRVGMTAGDGKDAPQTPPTPTNKIASGKGIDANGAMGGAQRECTCALHGKSVGGKGGDASQPGADGRAEPPATAASGADGKGGSGGASCGFGTKGPPGAAGEGGGVAPATLGTLTADGWTPGAGAPGAPGNPGGGGGGGGGGSSLAGGGGGCGGCGGGGGLGGQGGGGSIALASFQSAVILDRCTLVVGRGGRGANGGKGESGAPGEVHGDSPSCPGGDGGPGAGGGGGAGGAGGVALPIVRSGGSVTRKDSSFPDPATLQGGFPGNGGEPGGAGAAGGTAGSKGETGPYQLLGSDELVLP